MTAPTGSLPCLPARPVDDDALYFWDFSRQSEIVVGDSLVSVVGNRINIYGGDAALIVGTPQINVGQSRVYAYVVGGTPGQQYTLECVVTTDGKGTNPPPGDTITIAKAYILPVQ